MTTINALNIQTGFTGTTPTVWRLQAIEDRAEATALEWLKDYTNAVIRDDDNESMLGYPDPNQGYTRSYQVKRRLMGTGVSGTTAMRGSEEIRQGNAFTFSNTFRRNAVAVNPVTQATDILVADQFRNERKDLAEWAARKKEKLDIGRMLTGAMIKLYGNGQSSTFAGITNAMVLGDRSFAIASAGLKGYNGKPIEMLPDVDNRVSYRFYVMMVDETLLDNLTLDSSWETFIEAFNTNAGFNSPLSRLSFGKRNNVAILPIEKEEGFGSPLRPELIVGTTHAAITTGNNADVLVGLPKWNGSSYDAYTNDGLINFTEYLANYLTATGATSVAATVKKADGTTVDSTTLLLKLGSTNTTYTVDVAMSGGSYTPVQGDRIVVQTSAILVVGADAYVSSYPSQMWFAGQTDDYGAQTGMSVNFWEGGALTQNVRAIKNNILVNYVYADVLI